VCVDLSIRIEPRANSEDVVRFSTPLDSPGALWAPSPTSWWTFTGARWMKRVHSARHLLPHSVFPTSGAAVIGRDGGKVGVWDL
jgi:hypothetical protein